MPGLRKESQELYSLIAEAYVHQGKPKAQDLAEMMDVSIHQVYKALRARSCSPTNQTLHKRKIPYEKIEEVYKVEKCQKRVAKKLGIDDETVRRALNALGYGSRRKGYQFAAPTPLDVVETRNRNGETLQEIADSFGVDAHTLYSRTYKAGIKIQGHGQPKGKDSVLYNGGIVERLKSKHKEARRLGAKYVGRDLLSTEVIHHHDFDPHNNDPANLWYFPSNSQHTAYHNRLKRHRFAGREVDANLLAKESGGLPLLEFPSQIAS